MTDTDRAILAFFLTMLGLSVVRVMSMILTVTKHLDRIEKKLDKLTG